MRTPYVDGDIGDAQRYDCSRAGACAESQRPRLDETRDALLPLLMSGKVRVQDAEKIAEEAL